MAEAVRRITDELVEQAVVALEQGDERGLEDAVHDCRKRAKKLRGLIRLVRGALGDAYRPATESFRDAGRELSALRDAHAALATFDALVSSSEEDLPEVGLDAVRAGLAALAEEATGGEDRRLRTDRSADLFRAGRRHVHHGKLGARDWAVVGPGLRRTYRAGRLALAEVRRDPRPEAVHEWRKRVKDAWYHVRLLHGAAPSILGPLDDRLHDLSDALGDAHDLVVICERLGAAPDRFGGEAPVRAACELADVRRAELERRAVLLGARLYAEKPKAYDRRMGAYWQAWHLMGDEEPTGSLAV